MKRVERSRSLLRIFAAPTVLTISIALGLASGLLGDGVWDVLSWFALGLPLALIAWHVVRRSEADRSRGWRH